MKEMNIPVGVSDFEEIRKNGYYYIDKSGLIGELLSRTGTKVTLITRPRRFGKTLGMSMLENFFDIRKDSRKLFEGLEITENQALCVEWMNQYPTIFVSFRQVDGLNFTGAYDMLTMVIADLYNKHLYLLDSENATAFQKTAFEHLAHGSGSIKEVKSSLMLLTTMMQSYYEKPVILLIDEYDVPVAKANNNGYYDEMLDVMKGLMQALKDNQALRFAVVTGCLKIAKESIFTGTNNFVSDTITNSRLNEYFGFVQSEVDQLLKDADLTKQAENIKKWYDGYCVDGVSIYNPKSVVEAMLRGKFSNYWTQTETYEALKIYIQSNEFGVQDVILKLLAGEKEKIDTTTFSNDMVTFATKDDVLTLLVHLGYLTYDAKTKEIWIPNDEVMEQFISTVKVMGWGSVVTALETSEKLLQATLSGDEETVAELIEQAHQANASILKYNDENALSCVISLAYYSAQKNYTLHREMPAGKGFADIVFEPNRNCNLPAMIVELKWGHSAEEAIEQIKRKDYLDCLQNYHGEVLLVGVNYDKEKHHTCKIERVFL